MSATLRSCVRLLDRLLVDGADALGIVGHQGGDVALGGEFPLAMEGCLSDCWPCVEALSSASWSSSGIVLKRGPVRGLQSVFNRPG